MPEAVAEEHSPWLAPDLFCSRQRPCRTLGGPGEGPGQFRSAITFAAMPDGRVVAGDPLHLAYQIFDANGDYERRVRMGLEDVGGGLWEFKPDLAGDALFSAAGSHIQLIVPGA